MMSFKSWKILQNLSMIQASSFLYRRRNSDWPQNNMVDEKNYLSFYSCLNEAIFKVSEIICDGFLKIKFITVNSCEASLFLDFILFDDSIAHQCSTLMFVVLQNFNDDFESFLRIYKRNALNLEHIIIVITLRNQQTNSNHFMQTDIFLHNIDKCQHTSHGIYRN